MTRQRLRATFDVVLKMLTDPKAPRRDASGRDIFEVWADAILADPSGELARVAQHILPPEVPDNSNSNPVVTNIQALYLTAITDANRRAAMIEARAEPDGHSTLNGHAIEW